MELQKFLNDRDFPAAINFALKLWNSIEYGHVSKYEIILEHVSTNLSEFIKNKKNEANFESQLADVVKLLALPYPMVAVKANVQQKLVECLRDEVRKCPVEPLLDSVFTIILHQNMKNYFKDDLASYGSLLSCFFSSYTEYLRDKKTSVKLDKVKSQVEAIFKILNNYIKVVDIFPGFKEVFYRHIMAPLCEFVVLAKSIGAGFYTPYLTMVCALFFKTDNQKLYSGFFEKTNPAPYGFNLFDCKTHPIHVILVTLEAFLKSYSSVNVHCVEFLFQTVFELTDDSRIQEKLVCVNHFVGLLIKYDIKVLDASEFTTTIVDLVRRFRDKYLSEILDICTNVIHFSKYLLEKQIFEFIADFMFLKKSELEAEKYARFLRIIITEMYETESALQFVEELNKAVKARLQDLKLSKKLKRKQKVDETPSKKRKLVEGVDVVDPPADESAIDSRLKLVLLTQEDEERTDFLLKENLFTDISFAWPHVDVGRSFMQLCDQLRLASAGHPIVNYLVENLLEELAGLTASGASENQLFLVDFYACLLCEFFEGWKIAEKKKYRSQITIVHEHMHRLLSAFGNKLLNVEHNLRLMTAFLNLSYNYGNLEVLVLYYLPDNFTTKSGTEEDADSGEQPNVDVAAQLKQLYSYLSADEWSSLEQRVINFGKDECKNAMNRVYLQKLRANALLAGLSGGQSLTSSLMLASLNEFKQIRPILEDPCSNSWFVGQLDRRQLITVADLILESSENLKVIHSLLENREFLEMLVISIYKALANYFHGKSSVLKTVDFSKAHEFSEDVVKEIIVEIQGRQQKSMKKFSKDEICKLLDLLESFPLEYLNDSVKSFAFGLNLALFVDCAATKDEELELKAYNIFLKLLYHKLPQDLSQIYTLEVLLTGLPDLTKYKQFYEFYVSNACKCYNTHTQKNFTRILTLENGGEDENLLLLSLCIVQEMVHMTTAQLKKEEIASLLQQFVQQCIKSLINKLKDTIKPEILEKTFPGFLAILRYYLSKNDDTELLDQVKPLLQHYIDYCMASNSQSSKKLLSLIRISKSAELLGVEKTTLDAYFAVEWTRFEQEITDSVNLGVEEPFKWSDVDVAHLIVVHKTEQELKQLLKSVTKKFNKQNIEDNNFLILMKIFERLLNLASRLDISIDKIATIMAFAQSVIQDHLTALYIGKVEDTLPLLIRILHIYSNSAKRQRIVVYQTSVDTIFDVLLHINIKKLVVTNENRTQFFEMHDLISEILFSFVKKREQMIMNRVPQLLEVYRDLCRSICAYKGEESHLQLDEDETIVLAQLSFKLQKLTEYIISMGNIVKLVAPATLTQLIRTLIYNRKSAALPDRIKKIFRNICYQWIKLCNENAGDLITRLCRDDIKNIYTKLCKEYEMFVRFKGRI